VEVARQENTQQQDGTNANRNGHGQSGYQQEQQQQRHTQSSEDFLQQLRLGLIPLDGEGN
jgi:hypothetical protein